MLSIDYKELEMEAIDSADKQWSNAIYLIVYENHNNKRIKLYSDDVLNHFVNNEEQILEAKIWKHSLLRYIPPMLGIWHEFTIIKSTNYYWSFEKNTNGIYIQRSRDILDVKNMINGKNRTAKVLPEGRSNFDIRFGENINDIIKWIINTGELNNPFYLTKRSCHFFASLLYEAVVRAKNGRLNEKICKRFSI